VTARARWAVVGILPIVDGVERPLRATGDFRKGEEMDTRQIAAICHEANRAYCALLGDLSQPTWENAPGWQVESAINGVQAHFDAHRNGLPLSPSASHDAWLAEKLRDGWKHGPVKDAEKKEHPCIVPYEELPFEQRMKDYLFGAIVRAFAEAEQAETARHRRSPDTASRAGGAGRGPQNSY